MSTRCHIAICNDLKEQEEGIFKRLYHHCDGYPSGVGSELANILKNAPKPWTPESIQKFISEYDSDYRPIESEVAWDQEYVYIIFCKDERLMGYHKGFDKDFDIRWPGDEILIPDNEFSEYPTAKPKSAVAMVTVTEQLSPTRCEEIVETIDLDDKSTVNDIRIWVENMKKKQAEGTVLGNIVIKFK